MSLLNIIEEAALLVAPDDDKMHAAIYKIWCIAESVNISSETSTYVSNRLLIGVRNLGYAMHFLLFINSVMMSLVLFSLYHLHNVQIKLSAKISSQDSITY